MNTDPRQARVAIIGGGIAGSCLAYQLALRGISFDVYGGGSTGASAVATGVASLRGINIARGGLFFAQMQGHGLLRQMIHHLLCFQGKSWQGLSCGEYQRGVCEPFFTPSAYRKQALRTYGRSPVGFFGRELLVSRPQSSCFQAAHYYPDDYAYDPQWLLAGLRSLCHYLDSRSSWYSEKVLKPPLWRAGSIHLCGRSYSHVIIAVGSGFPSLLASWRWPLSSEGKLRFTLGTGLRWQAAVQRRELLQALEPPHPILGSTLWGWKQGKQSLRGLYHAPSQLTRLQWGSDDEVVSYESCLEQSCAEQQRCRDAVDRGRAQLKAWLGTKLGDLEDVRSVCGLRLALKSRKPLCGVLARELCGGIPRGRLAVLTALHKSGYALAPYLSGVLVELMFPASQNAGTEQKIIGCVSPEDILS